MFVFNLKRKWFDLVAAGKKTIEYREVKPYWAVRLEKLEPGHIVVFRCGYASGKDIAAEINFIDRGKCPYEGWTGDYYRIHFTVVKAVRVQEDGL